MNPITNLTRFSQPWKEMYVNGLCDSMRDYVLKSYSHLRDQTGL